MRMARRDRGPDVASGSSPALGPHDEQLHQHPLQPLAAAKQPELSISKEDGDFCGASQSGASRAARISGAGERCPVPRPTQPCKEQGLLAPEQMPPEGSANGRRSGDGAAPPDAVFAREAAR